MPERDSLFQFFREKCGLADLRARPGQCEEKDVKNEGRSGDLYENKGL
jgi:hypothetical protein